MPNRTRTRRRFTARQKAEAVELWRQEGLSFHAVARRTGASSRSWSRPDASPPGHRRRGLEGIGRDGLQACPSKPQTSRWLSPMRRDQQAERLSRSRLWACRCPAHNPAPQCLQWRASGSCPSL